MNKNDQLAIRWEKTRQGDVSEFGAIHHELYPLLYHYLLKITRDEIVSEDLLQELFIKMWERKERLGPIHNVKVYFFKAARSLALNYFKRQKNHLSITDDQREIDLAFSQEEIWVNSENDLEFNRLLALALNALPKRQKEMVFLKYFDGWTYEQIAEVTGINYQSVVNHIHRAMQQLRNNLVYDKRVQSCRVAV
ncbi:RNA polymerase sigma factor [Mucilaginibacter sp. AW1-7]|uniref:RNA polymerase sigma factor n=1 Tax=Mucilaginibacter sp. AW1-7 TaxID=3349874 RepID=UPI003F73E39F